MSSYALSYDSLVISHAVNPYGLWCTDTTNQTALLDTLHSTGEQISKYMKTNPVPVGYKLSVGQVVCYYEHSNKIWMRAVIDKIYEENSSECYLIWLTDFGHHLEIIKKKQLLVPLKPPLSEAAARGIYRAGLYGVVPACKQADVLFTSCEIVKCASWKPGAVKIIERCIKDAKNMEFIPKMEKVEPDDDNVLYGNITVTFHDDSKEDLSQILVDHHMAIFDQADFLTKIEKMKPIKRTGRIIPHPMALIKNDIESLRTVLPPSESLTPESRVQQWASDATRRTFNSRFHRNKTE